MQGSLFASSLDLESRTTQASRLENGASQTAQAGGCMQYLQVGRTLETGSDLAITSKLVERRDEKAAAKLIETR
jgi:hypothetical protein